MSCTTLHDILKQALPGRTREECVGFGLVYAGMHWKKDFRFSDVPEYQGKVLNSCPSDDAYWYYLQWLAAYLAGLNPDIRGEQTGLCSYVAAMQPKDAALMLGMEAGFYASDTTLEELAIEQGESFEAFWEDVFDMVETSEEYAEDPQGTKQYLKDRYQQLKEEIHDKSRLCPQVRHADVGYRVPLAVAIQRTEDPEERVAVLDAFYRNFMIYVDK